MYVRRRLLGTAGLVAASAVTGACSAGRPKPALQPSTRDKITYLTAFGSFGREGYAWVARDKGFFAEAGLEVDIKPGAAGDLNLKTLAAGQAQFTVIDYSGALVRAGNGSFGDFRCVAALTSRTLIALMSLAGYGIQAPADLKGKTIGQAQGAVIKTLFPAYARLAGVDPDTVKWLEFTPQELPALLASRRVDAIGQFVVGQPAIAKAAGGRDVVVLPYSNFLGDLYGNVLVTRTDLLNTRPELVQRFTGALLRGLDYAVAHPEEAGQILHKAVPTTDAVTAAAELILLRAYVGTQPGRFDAPKVRRGIALLQGLGLFSSGFDPEQLVSFDTAAVSPSPGRTA